MQWALHFAFPRGSPVADNDVTGWKEASGLPSHPHHFPIISPSELDHYSSLVLARNVDRIFFFAFILGSSSIMATAQQMPAGPRSARLADDGKLLTDRHAQSTPSVL